MKKILFLIAFCFIFNSSFSIIHWQGYPITTAIGTLGSQHRLECSVFDSLLGSWQYYSTPYFNSGIDTGGGGSAIIVFVTYHPPSTFYSDTTYGFVTYDQELHQFMPIIQYHNDPDVPGAWVIANDGVVTVTTQCCIDFYGNYYETSNAYFYDIKSHSWKGGPSISDVYAWLSSIKGGFVTGSINDDTYDPESYLYYYDPVTNSWRGGSLGTVNSNSVGGDQDLYYSFHDGMLWDEGEDFLAFDPATHFWYNWTNDTADYNSFLFADGIFYTKKPNSGKNYFGVFDDSLHQWKVDSTTLVISNVKIKDHVVAYTNSNKVHYQVYNPALHSWVKGSATVASGIDSIYIKDGTVKWVNLNGATGKRGFNSASGWGNYLTPMWLNLHITDFYSSTGEPLIFVRNYSIGTDSIMYDFGDGITTDWHQNSLWHQYKVNGHYAAGSVNYTVCIYGKNSTGVQSSCSTATQPCSATFNIHSNCPGLCNGHIAALPQTGQTPFSFQWSTGAMSSSIHNLCSGTYTVTITDNNGCSITHSSVINPMTVTATTNSTTCPGSCNGYLDIYPSLGAYPYSYLWSNGSTLSSVSNLCAGSYSVTVTDANSCTESVMSYVINFGNPITQHANLYYPTCSTCNDGEIDYNIQTGTPPYILSWSPNIGTVDTSYIYNMVFWHYISPGIYNMTLTDVNGCSLSVTDTLDVLMAQIIPNGSTTFCAGGSVLLTANSNASWLYEWLKDSNYISGAYSQTYLATTTGMYQVRADQGNGTFIISPSITVTVNPLPSALITTQGSSTFCSGDSVVLSVPFDSNCLYQWKKNSVNIPGATSANYSASSSGVYKVKVTNSVTGCSNLTTTGTVVTVNTLPSALITPQGSTAFCSGDSVILTVPFHSNCIYQWKKNNVNIPGATSSNYTATTGGIYKVKVTNSVTGCSKLTGAAVTVSVNQQPTATITANGPTTFCAGDSVSLTATSGASYTYQWKKNGANITGATYQNYNAKTAGSYKVRVSVSSCVPAISPPVIVTVPCGPIIDPNQKTEDDNSEEINPELFVSYNPLVQTALIDARHLKGKNYTLHVYDIIGKEVYKEEGAVITSGNENIYKKELNLFMYSKGIYAVTLQTEYDRLVKKFVKD